MAVTKYLDKTGLTYFWSKIKAWCNSLFALDSAVVHKTGNESISGTKTFNNQIVGIIGKSVGDGGFADMIQTYQSDNDGNRSCAVRCYNGDGYNEILIGAHDESNSAAGGLFIRNTDGTLTGLFNGSLRLTKTQDASGTADNSPALSIGSTSGTHLELDGNEIMAKSSGTATGTLWINAQGGDVYIGGDTADYKSVTGREKGSSTVPVYTDANGIVTACGNSLDVDISGNAATTTKLATSRTINGVSFDGSANITVADSTKVAKAGDTMTGNLVIKKNGPVLSLINNQVEINTTTAQLDTRINFYDKNEGPLGSLLTRTYSDKSSYTYLRSFSFVSTNYGNVFADISVGFDKDGNVKTSAPNPSASSNTNEIATTKWVNDKGYVLKSGDIMTGNLTISRSSPYLFLRDTSIERGTSPDSYTATTEILGKDKNNKSTWALYHTYDTDKTHRINLLCYNGLTTDSSYASISVGYDSNGNPYTYAPTPATGDNSTKIATTAFVKTKCDGYLPLSGGTLTGALKERASNVNISVEPASYKSDFKFLISKSSADTTHTGDLMRIGVDQGANTKDYKIILGVANPRAGNLPTQESIAGGTDDSDAVIGYCWGGIGIYYDYSKNRAYPYCSNLSTCDLSDNSSDRLATNYWVRNATGNFACNAATATKLATARNLKTKLDSTTDVTFDGSANQNAIPVTGVLPIANGGTGSSSKNFMDLSTDQTVSGIKTFEGHLRVRGADTYVRLQRTDGSFADTSTNFGGYYSIVDKNVTEVMRLGGELSGSNSRAYLRTYYRENASISIAVQLEHDGTTDSFIPLKYVSGSWTAGSMLLGSSSYRWSQVYAVNSTISTSDARLKTALEQMPDAMLDAWSDVDFVQFQMLNAVEEKGANKARLHSGLIAQQIEEVFRKHGLDASKYGFFCHDYLKASSDLENEDIYSLRYIEALCIEAAYMRRENAKLKNRIADLEDRLEALELLLKS